MAMTIQAQQRYLPFPLATLIHDKKVVHNAASSNNNCCYPNFVHPVLVQSSLDWWIHSRKELTSEFIAEKNSCINPE